MRLPRQASYKPKVASHDQNGTRISLLLKKDISIFLSFIPEKKKKGFGSPGISQAGLKLSKHRRVTLISLLSCLHLLSAAITSLVCVVLRIKLQGFVCASPVHYQLTSCPPAKRKGVNHHRALLWHRLYTALVAIAEYQEEKGNKILMN